MDNTPTPGLGGSQPEKGPLPGREPHLPGVAHSTEMQRVRIEVASGLVAEFKVPSNWQKIDIPEARLQFGAWRSPDGLSTVIPSSAEFASMSERDAQLSKSVRVLKSMGNDVPVVACLPVRMEDGTRALQINFPVNYTDGCHGFEYSHVVFARNRWARVAVNTKAPELDIPGRISQFHPITSSLRLIS